MPTLSDTDDDCSTCVKGGMFPRKVQICRFIAAYIFAATCPIGSGLFLLCISICSVLIYISADSIRYRWRLQRVREGGHVSKKSANLPLFSSLYLRSHMSDWQAAFFAV